MKERSSWCETLSCSRSQASADSHVTGCWVALASRAKLTPIIATTRKAATAMPATDVETSPFEQNARAVLRCKRLYCF